MSAELYLTERTPASPSRCLFRSSILTVSLLLLFSTVGCKELGLAFNPNCCCYPIMSSTPNDGHVVDPSNCPGTTDYCAGSSTDSSVEDKRAYALHCGKKTSLNLLDKDVLVTSNVGSVVPTLGFQAHAQAGTNKSTVQKPAQSAPQSDCENECANDSPFCLKVNLDDTNSMVSKVEKARQLMMDQTKDRIMRSQFMGIFDVKEDPCDRKDTLLSSAQITNEGQACFLKSGIQDGSATFTFVVSLPKTLQGKRSTDGNSLKISFEDPSKSPAVIIGDARYDHDFGGTVTWASANSSSGIIATKRGCIAVKTQNSQ